MSTCGYTCPQCEGRGFMEDGTPCDWCGEQLKSGKENIESDDKELGFSTPLEVKNK